ncbi:MAG TPA: metallophosphoesterase family protein [Thermoanaerobaculia bacterium]|nr:metallophosphoesterase family protein [Thermoanaerobaculia bacterium]
MRTLVHLSDLHFGDHDERTLEPLATLVASRKPDLVVVSGDLTQRARKRQFLLARAFLDTLPSPQVVVPGNHDIPLFDVVRRFGSPLGRYRALIASDVEPFFVDGEIAVMGLDTARSLTWKSGRLSRRQLHDVRRRLEPLPEALTKIVVTHHPFDLPPGADESNLIKRAKRAMKVFVEAGADVFLSGHLHVTHVGATASRYRVQGRSALVINAGTATSTRHRGELNSFNILGFADETLTLERYAWDPEGGAFLLHATHRYVHTETGWDAEGSPGAS